MTHSMQNCPHCPNGFGLKYPLLEDNYFLVVCDVHPLVEGHILIIPKEHISCIAALQRAKFEKFKKLYKKVIKFLNEKYGNSAAFEHGIVGQTVFHAHMHFLPFYGVITDILPKNCI